MVRHSKQSLARLEGIFKALGIHIRYEKGNFQSGYCLVTGKDMAIVNRFFDTEARMQALLEILEEHTMPMDNVSAEDLEWLNKLRKTSMREA